MQGGVRWAGLMERGYYEMGGANPKAGAGTGGIKWGVARVGGAGDIVQVSLTRSRSRSACRRWRQKRTEASEWGRVTGSPKTKSRTTAPSTSATFSAQKASVGHSHCDHPHGSSVWGGVQCHPAATTLCPP